MKIKIESRFLKSQAGPEYMMILMMLIGVSVYFLSSGFKENELTFAVATARSAGVEIALRENTVLKNVTYSLNGNLIILEPLFSDNTLNPYPGSARRDEIKTEVLERVRLVIAPNSQPPDPGGYCFNASRKYCIDGE